MSTSNIHHHPTYSNYYADGNGNIYRIDRPNSPLFQTTLNSGYKDVHFPVPNSKRQKHYLVHRFTYECYHGVVPRNLDVHHKDGDRTNNCIDNLEPVSHKINVQLRHGYKGKKFEQLDKLPDDAVPITKVKKNEFDNLYYVPSTDSFYVVTQYDNSEGITHDVYVKKNIDKDGRIHVMNKNGKVAHHMVHIIKQMLTHAMHDNPNGVTQSIDNPNGVTQSLNQSTQHEEQTS